MSTKSISSVSHENRTFQPNENFSKKAWLGSVEEYKLMYSQSTQNPEKFWGSIAQDFTWFKKWNQVLSYDWKDEITVKWFEGAQTNMTVNAIDRHLANKKDQTALLWVGNEPGEERHISYGDLSAELGRFSNGLKKLGVQKGDRVSIYMPMVPELAFATLACARIGAVHSVIFGGFSPEALKDRILDCDSQVLITTDEGVRGKKIIPLKKVADEAMALCEAAGSPLKHCLVTQRTNGNISMKDGRDVYWNDLKQGLEKHCEPERMEAEDPLFILYTSGSTGKPKGVLHTTAGYMVYAATTFKYVFDYHPGDIYWCTADIGWVTGHSYIVYGPLCNGATSMMFEGVPNYPDAGRFWGIVDQYKVNIFYTAPTALRALMREGDAWPSKYKLDSLKVLGTVGEPINPEAWIWYHEKIGHKNTPIVDTWWQTETGGILISPLPGAIATKPGSATLPFFGVEPEIIREDGTTCGPNEGGYLVIKKPWPGMMRTVYGAHERFKETYFSQYSGLYFTGDGAKKDEDGYYWVMGRVDDVLNVSGHRIGTAEVESALVSSSRVAESAVVGFPHEIKGQGIYAYVTLNSTETPSEDVKAELIKHVRKEIGPIATPDKIHFTNALPKTRSGKIMRRILRKIAEGKPDELGDVSTLADPSVVKQLLETS